MLFVSATAGLRYPRPGQPSKRYCHDHVNIARSSVIIDRSRKRLESTANGIVDEQKTVELCAGKRNRLVSFKDSIKKHACWIGTKNLTLERSDDLFYFARCSIEKYRLFAGKDHRHNNFFVTQNSKIHCVYVWRMPLTKSETTVHPRPSVRFSRLPENFDSYSNKFG